VKYYLAKAAPFQNTSILIYGKNKTVIGCQVKDAPPNKPDFIIIGAMKCATSTVHDQLSMHNSFFMTTPKEPNFFSDNEIYAKGFEWYGSLFARADAGQFKGESSTHYTKLPGYRETVKRMSEYCPDVKCIYIMRHPVDRLVSHFIHEWTQGVVSCDINEAVFRHPELIEYSRYNMQIEPYLKTFGHRSVLPMFTERLRDNPLRELHDIFDFLGVREKPVWHPDIISNISSERLRACAWRDTIVNNPILRSLRRTFVPKSVRTRIRKLWAMQKRPVLDPETEQNLEVIFNRDLSLLGQKLGLDLNCRNFKNMVISANKIKWADPALT
jgi:hypothetical protein